MYQGEHVRRDAPGNILFGYIGSAVAEDTAWLWEGLLTQGAALYQTWENFWQGDFRVGENPGDADFIRQGINEYHDKHN